MIDNLKDIKGAYMSPDEALELIKKYPKFALAYSKEVLGEFSNEQHDALKEIGGLGGESILTMVYVLSMRNLFDFFDRNKIYIGIYPQTTEDNDSSFTYDIFYDSNFNEELNESEGPGEYNTRLEAEKEAFIKAIEIYENR